MLKILHLFSNLHMLLQYTKIQNTTSKMQVLFELEIDLDDGKQQTIPVYKDIASTQLATNFVTQYSLNDSMIQPLTNYIDIQKTNYFKNQLDTEPDQQLYNSCFKKSIQSQIISLNRDEQQQVQEKPNYQCQQQSISRLAQSKSAIAKQNTFTKSQLNAIFAKSQNNEKTMNKQLKCENVQCQNEDETQINQTLADPRQLKKENLFQIQKTRSIDKQQQPNNQSGDQLGALVNNSSTIYKQKSLFTANRKGLNNESLCDKDIIMTIDKHGTPIKSKQNHQKLIQSVNYCNHPQKNQHNVYNKLYQLSKIQQQKKEQKVEEFYQSIIPQNNKVVRNNEAIYQKSKEFIDLKNKKLEEMRQLKEYEEQLKYEKEVLRECTFKPEVTELAKKKVFQENVYDRLNKLHTTYSEDIERQRNELFEADCTFKPQINNNKKHQEFYERLQITMGNVGTRIDNDTAKKNQKYQQFNQIKVVE